MKVSEVGEFKLVDLIAKIIRESRDPLSAAWQNLLVGIGDDAAVWKWDDSVQIAKMDSLVQGVHFPAGVAGWSDLGWKALAINLSDVAAMGGVPRYAMVYLGLPADTAVEDVVSLYRGMLELAGQSGTIITGGDTDSLPRVMITVAVLGSTPVNRPVLTRSAAKPGDKIAVTGYLGSAAGGYTLLAEKIAAKAEASEFLKNSFLRPVPRLSEGQLLVKHGIQASIDISDGLVSDLEHIGKASGVGAVIHADSLPVHFTTREAFGPVKARELALGGGEDYELLFTGSPESIKAVRREAAVPVTVIGEITVGSGVTVLDENGKLLIINHKGWEHFTGQS